jgi:hypothetical protein
LDSKESLDTYEMTPADLDRFLGLAEQQRKAHGLGHRIVVSALADAIEKLVAEVRRLRDKYEKHPTLLADGWAGLKKP